MKIRNGIPTQKEILSLCEKHGLLIYTLAPMYGYRGSFTYSREEQNDKAAIVAEELRKSGFAVEHSLAVRAMARTGQIKVSPKQ